MEITLSSAGANDGLTPISDRVVSSNVVMTAHTPWQYTLHLEPGTKETPIDYPLRI